MLEGNFPVPKVSESSGAIEHLLDTRSGKFVSQTLDGDRSIRTFHFFLQIYDRKQLIHLRRGLLSRNGYLPFTSFILLLLLYLENTRHDLNPDSTFCDPCAVMVHPSRFVWLVGKNCITRGKIEQFFQLIMFAGSNEHEKVFPVCNVLAFECNHPTFIKIKQGSI